MLSVVVFQEECPMCPTRSLRRALVGPALFLALAAVWSLGCTSPTSDKTDKTKSPTEKIKDRGGKLTNDDDGLVVTLTGWKGKAEDYALVKELKDLENVGTLQMSNADVDDDTLKNVAG